MSEEKKEPKKPGKKPARNFLPDEEPDDALDTWPPMTSFGKVATAE